MATGTTTDYNDTRNIISTDALVLLGIMGPDDALTNSDAVLCARHLNRIIKYWEASGAHIWTNTYATLWLVSGQRQYSLGNAVSDAHWANTYVETALTEAAVLSATTLDLTTTTAMTVGDNIGVVLDTGIIHWTTIASIPSSTRVTITTGIAAAAASGNYVYTYMTKPAAPLRILTLSRREGLSTNTSELAMLGTSFSDYQLLTNKLSQGVPLQWSYDNQLTAGLLNLWPVPNDVSNRLSLHYTRSIFDFDSGTNTPDVPQEWLQCLVYTLAVSLAPAYGRANLLPMLKPQADEMFYMLDSYDKEDISVYLTPTQVRY